MVLLGDRLLDLEQQLGLGPDLVGGVEDLGARGEELLVGDRRAQARTTLDDDVVPAAGELVDAGRRHRDAVLVVLDLTGYPDAHGHFLWWVMWGCCR